MEEKRTPVRLRPLHRRPRSARPAGRPPRGAGRDRPRRHGGLLAAHGAAGAAAPRHRRAARARRPDPRGLAAPPRLQRDNRLDGTLQEVRELLRKALEAERDALARDDGDDARFREMQLDALPSDTGGAVRELDEYDWRSADAPRGLRADPRPARPGDARPAVPGHEAGHGERDARGRRADPRDARRPQRPAREPRRGPGHHRAVRPVHGQARRVLPGEPAEHRGAGRPARRPGRGGAADANSMSEQQAELMELAQQAFGDPRLGAVAGPAGRPAAGPAARARTGRAAAGSAATTRWAWARPPGPWSSSASSTRWPSSWPRATRAPGWRTSTSTRSTATSATQARVDARALAELQRELERQGLFERAPDGSLQLSPKALRRLGESALRDVVDQIGARRGERETHRSGAAGEADRRDPAVGVRRHRGLERAAHPAQRAAAARAGGDDRRLDVTDVEIVETEQRTRAAVALCVDTSWSMVQDGRWVPMKRTALALHQLISTRFRGDDLKLITFGRHAAGRRAGRAGRAGGRVGAGHEPAPRAAARRAAPAPQPRRPARWSSWSPTASRPRTWRPTATPTFDYPTSPATLRATVAELDRLTGLRASFTFFVLGDDPRLARVHGRHRPPLRRPGGGPDAGRAGRRGGGGLPPQPPMISCARCRGRSRTRRRRSRGRSSRGRRQRWLCPECARRHVREIEAKLTREWWQ